MRKKEIWCAIFVVSICFNLVGSDITANGQQYRIPKWVKNNAGWWSSGQISDDEFVKAIQYLIQQGVIIIPTTNAESNQSNKIPKWVKNNAGWWSSGQISDDEFVKAIQYLITIDIIKIKQPTTLNITNQTTTSEYANLRFMIPILNAEDPQHDIQIIKPYLRSNDILVFPINQYKYVEPLKSDINGLNLATGGTSVNNLLTGIPHIPSDVKYVTYDYERGHTPEWTRDQNASIGLFDKLHSATEKNNKKLVIAPAWVFNPNFDWGEVAKHTDILVVQVQNFQTNATVPDMIKPAALGIDLKGITKLIVKEVRAKSPSTKLYLQFGFDVTDNPNGLLADINAVKDLGIDGVTLWYNSGVSGNTAKIDLMKQLLQKLET